jgi:tetratricopeptide (TPR) repeat protein
VAAVFAWFWLAGGGRESRGLMLVMGLVTLLHTVPWVLVNADRDASIARYLALRDDRVWGAAALIYANEDLAGYYRDGGDFRKAVDFYRAGLAIDSSNSRRWLGIASAYEGLGEKENVLYAYRRSVETGVKSPEVYNIVLALAAQQGTLDEGFASLKAGLARDSNNVALLFYLGAGYAQYERACDKGLPYLERAAALAPQVPQIFQAMGKCYHSLGRTEETRRAFVRYLELLPNAPDAGEVRRILGEGGR